MKRLIAVVTALSVLAPVGSAFAGPDYRHGPGHRIEDRRGPQRVAPPRGPKMHHAPRHHAPRWAKGQRLPSQYRGNVVRDYRRHNLRTPGRGQHWVRAGNDYVLVSAATGLIVGLMIGSAR